MTTMTFTATQDEKIMNFNTDQGYDAFVAMFDEAEIAEMSSWLNRECGYDYSWSTQKEANEGIVVDYVKEWLCQNIRNSVTDGTEQLFTIVYDVL